jgi:tetratricopeptide (TPR) repeat protein
MSFFKSLFFSKSAKSANSEKNELKAGEAHFSAEILDKLHAIDEASISRNAFYNETTQHLAEDNDTAADVSNKAAIQRAEVVRDKIKELAEYFEAMGDTANAKKYEDLFQAKVIHDLAHYTYRTRHKHLRVENYLKAIELGYPACNTLGVYFDDLENYQEAEKYYLKAIKISADVPKYSLKSIDDAEILAYKNLGHLYTYSLKKLDEAEKYYLLAIEHNQAEAIGDLGLLYAKQNKHELAIKYLKEAVLRDDKFHLSLGRAYSALKDYKLAEKHLLLALAHDDNNRSTIVALGMLYRDMGKYELAIKYLLQVSDKSSKFYLKRIGDYYPEIGDLYLKLNDIENAKKCFLMNGEI